MSTSDKHTDAHLSLADENFRLARTLTELEPVPSRWVAVISFYSAVHYLSALFWEFERVEITSHRQRGRLVRENPLAVPIKEFYERLYYRSLEARYHPNVRSSESIALDMLESNLGQVRSHILWHLHR